MKALTALVVAVYVTLYLLPLGVRPLMAPDEIRYAEIAREMLVSGDWVAPRLAGVRYFEKPVLGYWLNAAAMLALGENAVAARLMSALAAGGAALLVFLLLRRFGGGTRNGLLGALALLLCPEVFAVGTYSVLDSQLTLFVTGTLVAAFAALQATTGRTRAWCWALCGVSGGLAFLTKGFLAFAVPGVALVAFVTWQRQWRELLRWCWLPATVAAAVSLPWAVLIHWREPDFWRYFFWVEHVQRFRAAGGGQHTQPFWYLVPFLVGGSFPWLVFAPAWVTGLRGDGWREPLVRFSICWLVLPFVFFSASSGKLGTYVLPCFPPLIVLAVVGLDRYFQSGRTRAFAVGAYVAAGFALLLAVAAVGSPFVAVHGQRLFNETETWKALAIALAALMAATLLLLAARQPAAWRRLACGSLAFAGLLFIVPPIVPEAIVAHRCPGEFLALNAERVRPDTVIVADHRLVQPACWAYRRTDVRTFSAGGELEYGLGYPDARDRIVPLKALLGLLADPTTPHVVLLLSDRQRELMLPHLPPPAYVDACGEIAFVEFARRPPAPPPLVAPPGARP